MCVCVCGVCVCVCVCVCACVCACMCFYVVHHWLLFSLPLKATRIHTCIRIYIFCKKSLHTHAHTYTHNLFPFHTHVHTCITGRCCMTGGVMGICHVMCMTYGLTLSNSKITNPLCHLHITNLIILRCDENMSYVWHGSLICVTWLCAVTPSYVCHDVCEMTHLHAKHDSIKSMRDSWISVPCFTTHSWVCHDSFWRIGMCTMTRWFVTCLLHVKHDLFKCMPSLIHKCAVTHWNACHDSLISHAHTIIEMLIF